MESWKLTCPGALTDEWHDQYGNCCHTLTVAEPVTELAIKVSGLVRTRDTNGVVGIANAELPLGLYLRETPYTVCSAADPRLCRPLSGEGQRDRIEALHEIMLAIADDVEYSKGETHVHTTGAEALEQGSGRLPGPRPYLLRGLPLVSAFRRAMSAAILRTGMAMRLTPRATPGPTPLCEDLGWVSFDPSNRTCATESYIRTAVGLDYAEASPVRGVRSGGGVETMTFSVRFPSQQQQAQ